MNGSAAISEYLYPIGSESWWLREIRGARILDRMLLFAARAIFLATRFVLRVFIGRKRRDAFLRRGNIDFRNFLYSIRSFLQTDLLLEITIPEHDYKVHCPLNSEDFIVLTKHEDEILKHFSPAQGEIVVDIGAHMGRHTIVASKRVGPMGKVIAIEAHPYNYGILERNIALNNLANVVSVNSAVFSTKGKHKLYLPDEEKGFTTHHSVMAGYLSTRFAGGFENKYIHVTADTLDSILSRLGIQQVDWIKIDVEGAELEVLKGCHQTLLANQGISLLIEIHSRDNYQSVMDTLTPLGFITEFEKTYDLGDRHLILRRNSPIRRSNPRALPNNPASPRS